VGEQTAIAWTDHTFNPWLGCAKVSDGCKNCYAETLTKGRMGLQVWGRNGLRKVTSGSTWRNPDTWNHENVGRIRQYKHVWRLN